MTTPHRKPARSSPAPWRRSVRSLRVFISSTSLDLHEHRQRVHDRLERMYQIPVDMAQFGAGGADATTVSYTELSTADIVVLIVAWRYGFVPEGESRSVTQLEYEEARRLRLPIYVYLAHPSTEAQDGPTDIFPAAARQPEYTTQIAAFRGMLRNSNDITSEYFTSPDDLSGKVATALARRLLRSEFVGRHELVPARALDRTTFKLGDDDAATFDYLTEPVQDAWNTATQALDDANVRDGGKCGIMVVGAANAGKTRLALESVMQTLPEWPTLRWSEAYTSADLPPANSLPADGLVLFVDDLQNYAPFTHGGYQSSASAALLRALVESITVRPLVIVATCRKEDEARTHAELGWLFRQLTQVQLPEFSASAEDAEAGRIVADFQAHGATHADDWDGTLGSLVLGLSTRRELYEALVVHQHPAADVLRAMKLLTAARVSRHTKRRLRYVCLKVFHQDRIAKDKRVWETAVDELLRLQFVRIITNEAEQGDTDTADDVLVIRSDTYFDSDKVINDYPNPNIPGQLTKHLTQLRKVFVAHNDIDGLVALGNRFLAHGESDQALTTYERVLAARPKDAAAWQNKGDALMSLERYEEALTAYERALTLRPENVATWNNKGGMLRQLGRYEEALAAYSHTLALAPDHFIAWVSKGTVLAHLERYEEALAAYDQALALDDDPDHFHGIMLGNFEETLTAHDRHMTLLLDTTNVWSNKGGVLAQLERYEEALAALDQAVTLRPQDAMAWSNKGSALFSLERLEEALTAVEHALALDPSSSIAWNNKGAALNNLKRHEEALAALDRALNIDSNDSTAWFNKGTVLAQLERYDEALVAYERALTLRPTDTIALAGKGAMLANLKRYDEALVAYDQARTLDPGMATDQYAFTWAKKGFELVEEGNWEEVMAALDQALSISHDNAASWRGALWATKGAALANLKRWEEALLALDQALMLDPDNVATWNASVWANKGTVLARLERYEEALTAFDQELTLDSDVADTANIWNRKGYALLKLDRFEDAVAAIDQALKLEPENANWWDSRGEILLEAGRCDEAVRAYDEALARSPSLASSRQGKAQALRALGRIAEAEMLEAETEERLTAKTVSEESNNV